MPSEEEILAWDYSVNEAPRAVSINYHKQEYACSNTHVKSSIQARVTIGVKMY